MVDKLFELYYKLAHRNEELEQTIDELQTALKYRRNENIELSKQVERYAKDIDNANNDYKKCYAENVRLAEENNQLKLRIKMLTKIGFNSIYGIHCHWCKDHWVYTDTDSIKTESVEE